MKPIKQGKFEFEENDHEMSNYELVGDTVQWMN